MRQPVEVVRTRTVPATPEEIFAVLAEPENLSTLLPRVQRVEILEQGPNWARVNTHMSFGPFGAMRNQGEVYWHGTHEFVFSATSPVPIETRWTMTPTPDGTELRVVLSLDLAPMLGPLAGFVPPEKVAAFVTPDLDAALAGIARHFERSAIAR
jgi:hypothetical protein